MTSKFALVIANTEYQDASFAKLTAPGKDAEEFAEVLSNSELAAFDDVQILLNEGESKIRRSIARFFVNRQRDDLLLLYFSGHGVRNDQGQLFLAANDTEISILDATSIPADFVTHSMNNSRSQRQLLILDCCNSGAFAHCSKSASAIGKSMGIANAFEGSGFGRVVLTATDATQYAWEGDKVIGNTQKSVFTHFLIEGLKGDADRDGDGRIHVDELYDYTYEQVVRRTPKQTPGKWSYKQQGDLVLRENLKPRDVKPAPLPAELLEMLYHPNSGVRKAGIQELISLLDGKHPGLVRAAQDKLREIAENDDSLSLRKSASDTLIAHGITLEQSVPVEAPKESPPLPKPAPVEILKENKEEKKAQIPALPPHQSPHLTHTEQNIKEIVQRPSTGVLKPESKKPITSQTAATTYQPERAKSNLLLIGLVVGILLVVLSIWGIWSLLNNSIFNSAQIPTDNPNVVFTAAAATVQAQLTEQAAITTPTSQPVSTLEGSTTTATGKDGMTLLYVPAGKFTMGSETYDDEKPIHDLTLDAFWIDKTEVTNGMYAKCVAAGVCNPPSSTKSYSRDSYYGNSEFDNFPMIYVDSNMAKTYCEWADRRLPTEAEWEKAARGTNGRTYPWGNNAPNNTLLNYNNEVGDTTEVGKYPEGASPYGALDMAGNVWEWVADWYSETYYASSPTSNPLGPDSGQYRVLRGGSWHNYDGYVRSAVRNGYDPTVTNDFIGFRCSRSP